MTDYQDPSTIDVDEVMANINNSFRQRRQHWDDSRLWPNVTVKALVDEILRLRGLPDGVKWTREEVQRVLYHVVTTYDHWRDVPDMMPNEILDGAIDAGRGTLKDNSWWPNDA